MITLLQTTFAWARTSPTSTLLHASPYVTDVIDNIGPKVAALRHDLMVYAVVIRDGSREVAKEYGRMLVDMRIGDNHRLGFPSQRATSHSLAARVVLRQL